MIDWEKCKEYVHTDLYQYTKEIVSSYKENTHLRYYLFRENYPPHLALFVWFTPDRDNKVRAEYVDGIHRLANLNDDEMEILTNMVTEICEAGGKKIYKRENKGGYWYVIKPDYAKFEI